MTDTYPPLDGVPFKDGRYRFSDGSSIAPALMRDGMWITHPFGRVFLRRELPIGAKIHYDAPADALVALRAEGYALPAEAAKPEPVKPKMPLELKEIHDWLHDVYGSPGGPERQRFTKYLQDNYDTSPEVPPKPELFLVTNGREGAWVYGETPGDDTTAGGFYGLYNAYFSKSDGWRRMEVQP